MSAVQTILSYATLGLNISWVLGLSLFLIYKSPWNPRKIDQKTVRIKNVVSSFYREISFVLVTAATSGSLYFSQVLGWEPCLMCWYQRILMYPLVVLFGVAAFLEKDDVSDYALPLVTIGGGISFYHYLMQRVEQFQSAGCSITQVSCETQYTFYFDYITIPMMAFTVFLTVLMINWKLQDGQ